MYSFVHYFLQGFPSNGAPASVNVSGTGFGNVFPQTPPGFSDLSRPAQAQFVAQVPNVRDDMSRFPGVFTPQTADLRGRVVGFTPPPGFMSMQMKSADIKSQFPDNAHSPFAHTSPSSVLSSASPVRSFAIVPAAAPTITTMADYTPPPPLKLNIPPPQPHNRVLIIRSDKKPEQSEASTRTAAENGSAAKKPTSTKTSPTQRDISTSPAPKNKPVNNARVVASSPVVEKPPVISRKQSLAESLPASISTLCADVEEVKDPAPEAEPVSDVEPDAKTEEEQKVTICGVDIPISQFTSLPSSTLMIDRLQVFASRKDKSESIVSPVEPIMLYSPGSVGTPMSTTCKLLASLGMGGLMAEVDMWATEVIAEAAANGSKSVSVQKMVIQLQSFFDRGVQALYGSSLSNDTPNDEIYETPGSEFGSSGILSRGDKEADTITDFLAKLKAEIGTLDGCEYASKEELDHVKDKLVEAKRELKDWETRVNQIRKKNRKALEIK